MLGSLALAGCSSLSLPEPLRKYMGPLGPVLSMPKPADPQPASPDHEYLRVSLGQQKMLFALGLRGLDKGDVVEHWYSAQSELLLLRNGRIWQLVGTPTQWRGQTASPPSWPQMLSSTAPVDWTRQIDVMPGYRYGQTDRIQTFGLPQAPAVAIATPLGQPTRWFKDQVLSQDERGQAWRYNQVFAVTAEGQVLYSEQCVAPDLCLRLQYIGRPRR